MGVADHADDKGSYINVSIAGDAFVDEIGESEAVTHPGNGRDMIDPQHRGIIDELLCGRDGVAHMKI